MKVCAMELKVGLSD